MNSLSGGGTVYLQCGLQLTMTIRKLLYALKICRKSLAEHNLRRIEPSKFKTEVDVDGKGLKKVQEVECYPGIFKDTDGKAYDLRPLDSCPSLNNFTRMDKKAL